MLVLIRKGSASVDKLQKHYSLFSQRSIIIIICIIDYLIEQEGLKIGLKCGTGEHTSNHYRS